MAEFEVIFADVGQGDCTLLKLPNGEFMLVDVYRCPGHGIDIFKLLDDVLPDNGDGRKRLAHLVVTHAHDDHITGLGELYDRYAVEWLWLPQHEERADQAERFEEYQRVEKEHPDDKTYRPLGSRTPLTEQDLDFDLGEDVVVRCFSPPGYIDIDEDLSEEEARKVVHEHCLVLRVAYNGQTVILTGDSNVACWKRVVGYYKGREADETGTDVLKADVLHASHHGSRTFIKDGDKDSEACLEALEIIDPEYVVVSVGEKNRHDHPHEDMMKAYREQAGEGDVLETRSVGTIVYEVEEDGNGQLLPDSGRYKEDYGWDDDDEGEDDDDGDNRSGGGPSTARRRRSPTRLDNSAAA
jgi:competence protein ComEC